MDRRDRRSVVEGYIKARLELECRIRGLQQKLNERMKFGRSYISLIRTGRRPVSTETAHRFAEIWGMTYEELEKLAFEHHKLPYPPAAPIATDLPNLRETIEWCIEGKVYPYRFLRAYEREAEQAGKDRSRREWLYEIETAYAKVKGPPRPKRKYVRAEKSGTYSQLNVEDPPEPEVADAKRKTAK